MADRPILSPDDMRQLLEYDASTGVLRWKERQKHHFKNGRMPATWNLLNVGGRADKLHRKKNGAKWMNVKIFEKPYRAHRVIWAIVHGEWPNGQIDHINGDSCDNRIENLRVVDDAENKRNLPMVRSNKSGVMGVIYHPDKGRKKQWIARIGNGGKAHNIGRFYTKEEAVAARRAAEIEFGYHPNHGRLAKITTQE
ncbi:MAG: HNH endonuclease [Alphaproteobacteria bacterium]|nr:HNH endonuclease [Alphaproteobacteria bacterium]